MIETAIIAHLKTAAQVTGRVGSGAEARIWLGEAHQAAEYPYIVVSMVSDVPQYGLTADQAVAEMRVQIDCVDRDARSGGDGYSGARALGDAVHDALSGWTGSQSGESFQWVAQQAGRILRDEATDVWREVQDWMIGYTAA